MRKYRTLLLAVLMLVVILGACSSDNDEQEKTNNDKKGNESNTEQNENNKENKATEKKEETKIKGKYEFDKPDIVRGIYSTGHVAGGERFETLTDLIDSTKLNSMVIDIKDDEGHITYEPDDDKSFAEAGKPYIKDPEDILKTLQEKDIYPIARIVVFKDSVMAKENPDVSFQENGQVWKNGNGDAFVSPFKKEVWDYNLDIAKEAAEMGFQEIQFDYVRFPEGFETRADALEYDKGEYADIEDDVEARVQSVTDFVAYAEEYLADYDVDVSVDVFGYTAAVQSAPGIGQDLVQIGEHIDVLSSMIYPSHWGPGSLDVDKPDLEPYETVFRYAEKEKEKLFRMDEPPLSRPWIQDFTASYLGDGNYQVYGKEQIEAQIRALNESGIDEFLLWNASNKYTDNVDYTPALDEQVLEQVEQEDKKLRQKIEKEQESPDENDDTIEDNDDESNKEGSDNQEGNSNP